MEKFFNKNLSHDKSLSLELELLHRVKFKQFVRDFGGQRKCMPRKTDSEVNAILCRIFMTRKNEQQNKPVTQSIHC